MRVSLLRWPLLAILPLLSSCNSEAEVETTIPKNGQTGVDPRAIVAVRLSATMSALDLERNVDPRNITVIGDQTEGSYTGTITPAKFDSLFRGETIEQFRAAESETGTPNPPADGEDPADTPQFNALVFLLDDDVEFKPGERVTVIVDPRVSVRGSTMDDGTRFRFLVEGGSAPAAGEFFVSDVDPESESTTASLSPELHATFSQGALTNSLAGGIHVRGSQSGLHTEGSTLFGTGSTATTVVRRLADDDAFLPGEDVTVTYSSEIHATGNVPLSPFASRFQVKPGEITGLLEGETGWMDQVIGSSTAEPRGLVAADFRPEVQGVEIVAVYPDRLSLFVQEAPGSWTELDTSFDPGGTVRGVRTGDTNDDGAPDVIVVVQTNDAGRILRFEVGEEGDLVSLGEPFAFPGNPIDGVALADLDASGTEELIVLHGDKSFTPEPSTANPTPAAERTGFVTIFELVEGAGAELDPANPEALLERGWVRVARPIPNFERASRVELEDLDGDGRIDLVAATDRGLLLFRNQGTPSTSFAFRRVGFLLDGTGAAATPESFVLVDADRDRDIDILAWSGGQGFFYENRQPAPDDVEPGQAPTGLLFESFPPVPFELRGRPQAGDEIVASNLDGDPDGAPDLIVSRPGGAIDILIGSPDAVFAFEVPRSFAGASGTTPIAIADIDGDTGLDVIRGTSTGIRALLSDSSLVSPVSVPERSRYRLVLEEESEDTIAVRVIGDLRTRFSGYSIALDFEESVLEYLGFEIPAAFERTATFELCPTNVQLLGCTGSASARMTYQRDTVGVPTDGVDLGAFRFRLPDVEEDTETTIELRDFDEGNRTFRNAVTAKVGDFSQDVAVTDLGEPIELSISAPPPDPGPELSISCSVVERFAKGYRGRVAWSSPRGAEFDRVLVTVNGRRIEDGPIAWTRGSVTFDDDSAGSVSIEVLALLPGVDPENLGDAPFETCGLISIFQPEVICESRTGSNIVRWTLEEHTVESFRVYRNGIRLATVSGSADFVYEDRFPSPQGADNYEVAGVIASTEGPRGSCRGQDPSPCITQDPVVLASGLDARTQPSSPNVVRFRWRNGEAYDRLVASLAYTPPGGGTTEELPLANGGELNGGTTELVFDGDIDRGGAMPGTYELRLQGFATPPAGSGCNGAGESVPSAEVVFPAVPVPVPGLTNVNLTCASDGNGGIVLSWRPVWGGFDDFLRVLVTHEIDGDVESSEIGGLLRGDSGILIDDFDGGPLEPFGSYRFRLIASFNGTEATAECGPIAFEPEVTVPDVEGGIALAGLEIPVTAIGVREVIEDWEATVELPNWLVVSGLTAAPAGPGRQRVVLRSAGEPLRPGEGRSAGGAADVVELARIVVSVPADFSLSGRSEPLAVTSAKIRFRGTDTLRTVPGGEGTLRVRERWVALDHVNVDAGDEQPIRVGVRTTFTAPPNAPNYKFNAFQIHIAFDKQRLELLPVRLEDQVGTAIGNRGFLVFPDASTLESANESGFAKFAWLGFNFAKPSEPQFLEPVTNKEILVLRFRSRVPAGAPEAFAPISFVTDPSADQPTAFFPVEDVPGVPDMDAFLAGGVEIVSDAPDLAIVRVEPARGALTGGNAAKLVGRGFPLSRDDLVSLELVSLAGVAIDVDEEMIDLVADDEIHFVVPDSGLRSQSFLGRRLFDVRLETSYGTAVLPRGYAYEAPVIESTDVTSVRALGSDFVTLSGRGLPSGASAEFVVDGFATPFPAQIFRGRSDGTKLVIIASNLPAPAEGEAFLGADLRLHLPDGGTVVVPSRYRILQPSEEPSFTVLALEPNHASQCGGSVITVLGVGFTPATRLAIADAGEVGFELVSSRELRFTLPASSEAGNILVRLTESGSSIEAPFTLDLPPAFVRGDIDGDGSVAISDATLLSRIVVALASADTGQANHDAWDVNDDGTIDFGDSIYLLRFLFEGGTSPAFPFPTAGQDPDNLADGRCQ